MRSDLDGRLRVKRPWVFVLLLLAVVARASAQDAPVRRYLPDPADEDWSFLASAPRVDVWDPVKYIRLPGDDRFITLSGEVRYRPEGFRIHGTDAQPGTIDSYLLQRYLFGADVHVHRSMRVFVELQSGIIDGALRSPRPTDRNRLDIHQAFFEWGHARVDKRAFAIKAGRQELSVGSTRLISASPGLNVKRSFDGVAASYGGPSFLIAGAVAQLVSSNPGVFDDGSELEQPFWGIATARRSPWLRRGDVGVYYLGIDRSVSVYVQGAGHERRHTVGLKWDGNGSRVDLNYDMLFQWGEFIHSPIRAWAFASETGYRPISSGWKPRISARADVASGDRDATDGRLESFNPLFPGNSYSGAVGLFGPTNLTDVTPAVNLYPRANLMIGFEAPSYWRTSTADGIYATSLRPLVLPTVGNGRYVGTNPGVLIVWQATRHCQLQGALTRFLPGGFLKNTFIAPGFGFYSASAVYRF
jgi:hypothetical protein